MPPADPAPTTVPKRGTKRIRIRTRKQPEENDDDDDEEVEIDPSGGQQDENMMEVDSPPSSHRGKSKTKPKSAAARPAKRPPAKRQKLSANSSDGDINRFKSLPDTVILHLSTSFLGDTDAFRFGRTDHRMIQVHKQYGIKDVFDESALKKHFGELKGDAANSQPKPRGRPPKKSTPPAPHNPNFKIGEIRNVELTRPQHVHHLLTIIPSTVRNLLFDVPFQLSLAEVSMLPPSLVTFGPLDGPVARWIIRLTRDEFESKKSVTLPSKLRQMVWPIVVVEPSKKGGETVEVDSSPFIRPPMELEELVTCPSLYSHTISLPESMESLSYGGSSSKEVNDQLWPVLPSKLQRLLLTESFRSTCTKLTSLPPSLTEIDFSELSGPTVPLESLCQAISEWPKGLTKFRLPYNFNQPIEHLSLPPGLTSLDLSGFFNQPLEKLALPPALTSFECNVSHPLGDLKLPPGLTSLEIGEKLGKLSWPKQLPSTLRKLVIKHLANQILNYPTFRILLRFLFPCH